ncbi:hypothetical protein ACQ4PT_021672 [Festuca glaucescens]
MHMDDLVSDAEDDIASCEEISSEETEDVKICLICGDVGEEKKLAVCSRCNDGAVHTYCMRVMLQKVPESGWSCEECQAVVEIEIGKKKLEKVKGNVVMISMENKVDAKNVAHKESHEDNQGNDINFKTKEEDAGIIEVGNVASGCTPSVKENDSDLCITNKALHDCDLMSTDINVILNKKSLDGGVHSLEKCNNDASSISKAEDVSNMAAWNKRLNRQSDAKNSEQIQLVKVCDICGDVGEEEKLAVCSRCNDGAEHVYCMQVMMEKVPEVMWLCEACQTEVEVAKESMEPEKSQVLNALKNKAPPLHGSLLKSVSFNNPKVPKVKQLVIEVPPKPRNSEEPLSSLTKQEESISTLAKSTQIKKANSNGPANKGKSSRLLHAEEPSIMTSRMSANVTNKRGTYISGYPSVAASLPVPVPSKLESAAQHLNKRNKVESLGIVYAQGSTNFPAVLCTSISHARSDEQDVRNGMPTPSSTASVDCPELKYKEHQATSAMGRRYANSSSTMLIDPKDKLPIVSPCDDGIASSFPELAYIWQGCFELWRTGRSPELLEGLQVHLSCSASPKVLEIAKKFPSKILLEELPRQNLWPPHNHENDPSIGLFFFARDIQSYESHYSKLVGNMLKDDLALRGNIGTAELLIFPSNILSKNVQRWNMCYYLWGVFRVRRRYPNLPPHVPTRAV